MVGKKILLVDDEVEFVSTLAERLQLRGIEVMTAHNGEGALQIIDQDPPHLVVMDMMMPGMGGLETLRRIKLRYPNMRVILLTGHGCTKDGAEGLLLGAEECLMKPLEIDVLIKKLREEDRPSK
ncbi:MAG: response regulator [Deltaproteobacteria bacterium]|nr:response regulator [Deltaproteobacteria bacterium]